MTSLKEDRRSFTAVSIAGESDQVSAGVFGTSLKDDQLSFAAVSVADLGNEFDKAREAMHEAEAAMREADDHWRKVGTLLLEKNAEVDGGTMEYDEGYTRAREALHEADVAMHVAEDHWRMVGAQLLEVVTGGGVAVEVDAPRNQSSGDPGC